METLSEASFKQNYARHLQHLKLKGLQPKTISSGEQSPRHPPPDRSPARHRQRNYRAYGN